MKKHSVITSRIEHHIYDINIIRTINSLEQQATELKVDSKPDGLPIGDFIERLRDMAADYHQSLDDGDVQKKYSFDELSNFGILIVSSKDSFYQIGLTLDLLARNSYEIHRFLDYQHEHFIGFNGIGSNQFINLLEYLVVPNMKFWVPFYEADHTEVIFDWIVKRRGNEDAKEALSSINSTFDRSIAFFKDQMTYSAQGLNTKIENVISQIQGLSNRPQRNNIDGKEKKSKTGGGKVNVPYKFENMFIDQQAFESAIAIMVSRNSIDETTHLWIDQKKGMKLEIAITFKNFESKNYFRKDVKLNAEIIQQIAKDFFKVSMGVDIIGKAKQRYKDLNFIPLYKVADGYE